MNIIEKNYWLDTVAEPATGARGSLPDISNNVGPVKYFVSVLLRSLRRVVFLVLP